ncbi:hypothetical protein [Amycolatopsis sp. NPDC051061]|uniref:MinD/ParA family ATP-binding protein n=1 Tax=Amycolatopsis sp. NPDC051061 TaxID=3155042 RepID=UPI00343791B3
MLIAFTSLQGSPGVSAAVSALTWTWPRHAVMAECDPTGAQAMDVYDPDGSHGRPSVFEVLAQARSLPLHRAMSSQMVVLPDGTGRHHLLPGARSPREAESLDWRRLTDLFVELDTVDVLADCGRVRAGGAPYAVITGAALLVLVVANSRNSLRKLVSTLDVLREETGRTGDTMGLLVVDPDPRTHQRFSHREIAEQFAAEGLPMVGWLPWDPAGAAQFTNLHRPSRRFESSPLLTTARKVADEIARRAVCHVR